MILPSRRRERYENASTLTEWNVGCSGLGGGSHRVVYIVCMVGRIWVMALCAPLWVPYGYPSHAGSIGGIDMQPSAERRVESSPPNLALSISATWA
jgi:hypothetical protein